MTVVEQDGNVRVRLTLGVDDSPSKKNTDMTKEEVTALIGLLTSSAAMLPE